MKPILYRKVVSRESTALVKEDGKGLSLSIFSPNVMKTSYPTVSSIRSYLDNVTDLF